MLAATFDEPVDIAGVDTAKLAIVSNSGSVALDGATLDTTNSTNIAVQLTEAQQSVAGLGTFLLPDMGQGAVHDLADNSITDSDQTPPTVTSATHAPSSQPGLPFYTYAITFSEILGGRISFRSICIGVNLSQSYLFRILAP